MVVRQQLWISFLSLSFKFYVVTLVSVLPDSNLGALFYTHGRTPRSGGRPANLHFIFGPWPAGQGEWLADQLGWPAGHLPEIHLAGQLSAFHLFTAVQLLFEISHPSGGYFGRESLDAFPSPFTPFLAYLRGWTAPSLGLQHLISRTLNHLPPFSSSKTPKKLQVPSPLVHQP